MCSVSFLHLGIFNPILNLGIAGAKAALIAWFFKPVAFEPGSAELGPEECQVADRLTSLLEGRPKMHLRAASGIVQLFAGAALFWLVMMFGLGLNDWLAR